MQRHVALYRAGGDEALVPKKRGPKAPPNQTPPVVEDAIVVLRKQLGELGLDAGARTIAYHLGQQGLGVPAIATIHRILPGGVRHRPAPEASALELAALRGRTPNECWQTDMTHWHLEDDSHVEIVNFIDDHSRAVMASVAVEVATAPEVVRIFFETAATYGLPASVLSDNGAIYTAAYRGAATGLEIELASLGITFKHGKPYHPQTQGKVERYHRTLKGTCVAGHSPKTCRHCRRSSTASSPPTTRSVRTRPEGVPRCRRGGHSTGPRPSSTAHPYREPPRCATTKSTTGVAPSATARSSTTSGSDGPTRAGAFCSWSATWTSGSSRRTANFYDNSPSTPRSTTRPSHGLPSEGSSVPEIPRQNSVELSGLFANPRPTSFMQVIASVVKVLDKGDPGNTPNPPRRGVAARST